MNLLIPPSYGLNNIPMIRICEIDLGNPKTRNWFMYETFYYFWVKGFSTWRERERHNLSMLTAHRQLSTQPTRGARSAQSRLASPSSESQSSSSETGTHLCFFSNLSPRYRCVTSPKYPDPISIWSFYFNISLRARVNTCVNVAPY